MSATFLLSGFVLCIKRNRVSHCQCKTAVTSQNHTLRPSHPNAHHRRTSGEHPLTIYRDCLSGSAETHLPLLPKLRQKEHVRRFRSCGCIWWLFSPCPFLGYLPAQIPDRLNTVGDCRDLCLHTSAKIYHESTGTPKSSHGTHRKNVCWFRRAGFQTEKISKFARSSTASAALAEGHIGTSRHPNA